MDTLHEDQHTFGTYSYLAQFFIEWEMFQKKAVEKISNTILYSKLFFRNSTVYEIMWENIVDSDGPLMCTYTPCMLDT